MAIHDEEILVTRTTFSELKISPAGTNGIHLQILIFRDDELSKMGCDFLRIERTLPFSDTIAKCISSSSTEDVYDLLSGIMDKLKVSVAKNRQQAEHHQKKIDSRLLKINRYIRNNYHTPITLKLLANLVNVNPIYLSNTYSKVFQMSPIYFLNTVRINQAKKLMETDPETPIHTIATRVGFSSTSHFCITFKRYTSMSPSEYRRKLANID